MDVKFGERVNPENILLDTLKEKIITNPIENQLMMLESYDVQYGICSHDKTLDKPYSLVEVHDVERTEYVNPLYEMYDKFIRGKVHKHTGLTLDTFLTYPREDTIRIFELCAKYEKIEMEKNAIPPEVMKLMTENGQ